MKTPAQRQAEYREKAMSKYGRARLTVMLPTSSLSALDRLAKHRGVFKWKVLADLLDAAEKQLPGSISIVTR